MKNKEILSCFYLLLAAGIWGFAFVAQRVGAAYLPPFAFNGIRFALGALSLFPLIMFTKNKQSGPNALRSALPSGILTGCVLFVSASLQQIGMMYTSAGKAGFITGFYMVIVPVFGIFLGQRTHALTWVSVVLALTGLYFISVTGRLTIGRGDLFVLAGSFGWSAHIFLIDRFSKKTDALKLSLFQFVTCSALSLIISVLFERVTLTGLSQACVPILYGGIASVGIAYTLQVIGQRYAKPAHSAIILSMESFFAALGGFIILKENMGIRGYFGCALMILGMLLSQYPAFRQSSETVNTSL